VIGSVLGLLAIGVVALVISLTTAGRSSGHGCIDVSVQAATGGSELYRCGAQARAVCASARTAIGVSPVVGHAIAAECRKAGLPVG
jgi:hypothetical protein